MNDRLNIAVVGCGGFTGNVACEGCSTENIVALCDVDASVLESRRTDHPDAELYRDFRKMLAEMGDRIDAVTVSTPDHTHYPIAMNAIRMGKHVFVQKPLAHSIGEVRALRVAAREAQVVTQMGNQGHTSDGIRTVREWIQAGILGKISEVHAWTDRPRAPWFLKPETVPPPSAPVPPNLDWDLWLGPAEKRPYSPAYLNKGWRTWWDFGCGALGDMGCHILDTPFWALDLGPPSRIDVKLNDTACEDYTAFGAMVMYHFEEQDGRPPLRIVWYEGDVDVLLPPEFEEDREITANGTYILGDKATVMTFGSQPDNPTLVPETKMRELKDSLPPKTIPRVNCGPVQEWIRAIKDQGPRPGANFEYACPLTEMVLLGTLAIRTGQTIEWDADSMQITNAPELNQHLDVKGRDGWKF